MFLHRLLTGASVLLTASLAWPAPPAFEAQNPVRPGDWPYPSVIRVGADYRATATSAESVGRCPVQGGIASNSDGRHWLLAHADAAKGFVATVPAMAKAETDLTAFRADFADEGDSPAGGQWPSGCKPAARRTAGAFAGLAGYGDRKNQLVFVSDGRAVEVWNQRKGARTVVAAPALAGETDGSFLPPRDRGVRAGLFVAGANGASGDFAFFASQPDDAELLAP